MPENEKCTQCWSCNTWHRDNLSVSRYCQQLAQSRGFRSNLIVQELKLLEHCYRRDFSASAIQPLTEIRFF